MTRSVLECRLGSMGTPRRTRRSCHDRWRARGSLDRRTSRPRGTCTRLKRTTARRRTCDRSCRSCWRRSRRWRIPSSTPGARRSTSTFRSCTSVLVHTHCRTHHNRADPTRASRTRCRTLAYRRDTRTRSSCTPASPSTPCCTRRSAQDPPWCRRTRYRTPSTVRCMTRRTRPLGRTGCCLRTRCRTIHSCSGRCPARRTRCCTWSKAPRSRTRRWSSSRRSGTRSRTRRSSSDRETSRRTCRCTRRARWRTRSDSCCSRRRAPDRRRGRTTRSCWNRPWCRGIDHRTPFGRRRTAEVGAGCRSRRRT